MVEARAELATCSAASDRASEALQATSVEATAFEAVSGLAAAYLAVEATFRPIWARYFTTAYPPDRCPTVLPTNVVPL